MRDVAKRFPDDLDAAVLFAEALMDTMPWNYWREDGKPKPETEEVLATLESVLKREPQHAGACHYYIHAVEASPNPERGLAAAHRLRYLVPGAGHLVHMPSHIYLRLGNYHEASLCNERAVDVDEAYISRYRVKPPFWYFPLRQRLGAALVEGARFQEAEKVYREDLKRHPENGWSLFGLLQCLRAQGKFDAADAEKRFRDAWKHADVTLTTSSF